MDDRRAEPTGPQIAAHHGKQIFHLRCCAGSTMREDKSNSCMNSKDCPRFVLVMEIQRQYCGPQGCDDVCQMMTKVHVTVCHHEPCDFSETSSTSLNRANTGAGEYEAVPQRGRTLRQDQNRAPKLAD